MKIGIVGSGTDILTLFKILHKYDHDYIVHYDDLLWPYGDKPATLVQAVIADAIDILRARGCEKIILPPVRELVFREHKDVLPLFQTYLMDYCFHHSLVGKIGCIGDWSDLQIAQPLLEKFAAGYTLTDNQKNIKTFQQPFARWMKEAPLRKYFLTTLSYSHPMANKIVKFDLLYLKDAAVDTVIPLNYGYFNYQKTIHTFFNSRKSRFHKIDTLEECFVCSINNVIASDGKERGDLGDTKIAASSTTPRKDEYAVTILYTGQKELLQRQKKIMWVLERGKGVELVWEKI